jgi:hypothetical protein
MMNLLALFIVLLMNRPRPPSTPEQRHEKWRLLQVLGLLLVLVFLLSSFARAQTTDRTFQDANGHTTGRSSTDSHGNTTFYDDKGHNTGRAVTSPNGTTLYDDKGREIGRIQRSR